MRKKRERKIRINLKALEETSIFLENERILFNSLFLLVSAFIGLLDFPCYATRFKYLLSLGFQRFRG